MMSPGDVELIKISRGIVQANVIKNNKYKINVTNIAAIVPPGISYNIYTLIIVTKSVV